MVSTFYIFSHKTEFSKAELLASLVSLAYSQVKKAALPATGVAASFGAVVARCRAVAPAIAASGPCRWSWRGRAAAADAATPAC